MRARRPTQCRWVCPSILAALLITSMGYAQHPRDRREFMRKKLEYSKNVLEGLSLEDFGLIARNARAMKAMSEAAAWRDSMIPNPQDYIPYTMEFQRQVDELKEKANKKDLDGASLTYNQLILTCIKCHKYARLVTR